MAVIAIQTIDLDGEGADYAAALTIAAFKLST